MPTHKLQTSFNAGELSPLMDSRVDLEKYDAGCRRLRNFVLHTHGPVFRRPGLEYMGDQASDATPSRFIAFNFSATTTFVIEMAAGGVFRFWHNGALVKHVVDGQETELAVAHPYQSEELFEVQCKQVNDVCYLAHPKHHPLKLTRYADNDWRCETMPLRYPPLLDEFVEKESVSTPVVTEIHNTALEEAEEFTLARRTPATAPTFTISARTSALALATCTYTNGSAAVTVTGGTSGRVVGEVVTGGAFPAGTVITEVNNSTTLTLSNPATASGTASLNFCLPWFGITWTWPGGPYTCGITSASKTVTMADTADRSVGEGVAGTGIPAGAYVAEVVDATTLKLSAAATVTNAAASLTFSPGAPAKSLDLQVWRPRDGTWVSVPNAIPLSTTATAPQSCQFQFRAAGTTGLVVDKKAGTAACVNLTTLASFFSSITFAGGVPNLQCRLVYGGATTNDLTGYAVTATDWEANETETPLVHVPQTNTSKVTTATWTLPATVPAGHSMTWQVLNGANKWADLYTIGINAALDDAPAKYRLRYSGTLLTLEEFQANGSWAPKGASAEMAAALGCAITLGSPTVTMASTAGRAAGEAVTGAGIAAGTTIASVNTGTQLTLSAPATATLAAAGLTFFKQRDSWNLRIKHAPETSLGMSRAEVVSCGLTAESDLVTMGSTTGRVSGEGVSGTGIPLGTTIESVDSGTQVTLSNPATVTNLAVNLTFNAGAAWVVVDDGTVTHTAKVERQESGPGADAGKSGVMVPAGSWQARVEVTAGAASVPPDGATVTVQKWNGASWVNLGTRWTLKAGQLYIYSGVQASAFTADTLVRLLYRGGSGSVPSRHKTAGFGVIEKIVYPPSKSTTLEVSVVNGTGRTMLAKDTSGDAVALFKLPSEDRTYLGHEGSFWQIAHRRDESYAELVGAVGTFPPGTDEANLRSKEIRVSGRWDLFTYGSWKGTLHLERRTSSNAWQIIRSWTSNYDRNVAASGNEEQDADLRLRVKNGAAGQAASGAAVPRFVLEAADSRSYGLVKITKVVSASEATVDVVRTLGDTTATSLWAEGAWSDVRGYPAAIGLHEARLWFGGSRYQPQTLWASVSNDFENFRRSTQDDGALAVTLAAESSNSIRWLSSTTALLIGTGGEEWAMRSGGDGLPLTPTNIRAERQSGYSSMALGAKMAHEVTIFVQRDERRVRQLRYTDAQQSYTAGDLTVLAPHVTAGGVRQMAFQQAPTAILWVVTKEGKLAGMTFEREQSVFGWHIHDTDGEIETVAVLHGTRTDQVWCGVKRTINGVTKRTVERMQPQAMAADWSDPRTLIYSDCAKVIEINAHDAYTAADEPGGSSPLDGVATAGLELGHEEFTLVNHTPKRWVLEAGTEETDAEAGVIRPADHAEETNERVWRRAPGMTLRGLDHLKGKKVTVLTDGMVYPPAVVVEEGEDPPGVVTQNGELKLDVVALKVVVGLPYTSELQPMKQEVQLPDGTAQGRKFKLHSVTVRLDHSLGGEVSANADDPTLPWARLPNVIVLGEATPLFTGERNVIVESRHETAVNVTVRQRDPLPLNVTSLILRYDVYGS